MLQDKDATADNISRTMFLPSGLGTVCALKYGVNVSLNDEIMRLLNISRHNFHLVSRYFVDTCQGVFSGSEPMTNYVPPIHDGAIVYSVNGIPLNSDTRLQSRNGFVDNSLFPTGSLVFNSYIFNSHGRTGLRRQRRVGVEEEIANES